MRSALLALLIVACGHSSAHSPDAGTPGDGTTDSSDGSPTLAELAAVSPPLSRAGLNVTLEGTFSGNPIIQLPGGVSATAVPIGPHRARMTVPPGTTLGAATGGGLPVMFHASTYPLGLRRFETYEQGEGARQPGILWTPHYGQGTVALDSAIYLIGGTTYNNGNMFLSEVERASLNADGSIGTFNSVPGVTLVHPRSLFATVVTDNFVYVIGGLGNDDPTSSSVEVASIMSDDSLGPFSEVSMLTIPRTGATADVIGNYLYVIGGTTAATANMPSGTVTSIERATINPDGTLSPFELVADASLMYARESATSAVIGDQVYVVGGAAVPYTLYDDVEAAPIMPDGTIGTFALVPGVNLLARLSMHSMVVLEDGLYVFGGGGDFSNQTTEVERAPINNDGSLGTFQSTGIFVGSWRLGASIAFSANDVYLIGGEDAGGTNGDPRTLRASLDVGDLIDTFSTANQTALESAVYDHAMVAIGNALYAIGGTSDGTTASASVQRAPVHDGMLGAFHTLTDVSLSTARSAFATAVIGNYVYVIGGSTSNGIVATLERAPILPDGTLGQFAPYSDQSLLTARAGHAALVTRGVASPSYLFVVGGIAADGTILGSVEAAPINPDGSLGAFVSKSGYGLTTPRYDHTLVFIEMGGSGGYALAIGGRGANGELDDVERGVLIPDGTTTFVPLAGETLATARANHASTVIGDRVYAIGGTTSSGPLTSVESAQIQIDPETGVVTLAPFTQDPNVGLTEARGHATCTTVGNRLYAVGGLGSTGALATIESAVLQ